MSKPYLNEAPLEWSLSLKDWILEGLYKEQINYWNSRLRNISNKNVDIYDKSDAEFLREFDNFVGIFFNDKVYYPISGIFWGGEYTPSPYVLELANNDPKLIEEMEVIAVEMDNIKQELHEVTMFVGNFLMFDPTLKIIKKVLGESIGRMCQNAVSKAYDVSQPDEKFDWPLVSEVEMYEYISANQPTIEKMQQRKLLNLITV